MSACVHNHDPKDCGDCREAEAQHKADLWKEKDFLIHEYFGRVQGTIDAHEMRVIDPQRAVANIKSLIAEYKLKNEELRLQLQTPS